MNSRFGESLFIASVLINTLFFCSSSCAIEERGMSKLKQGHVEYTEKQTHKLKAQQENLPSTSSVVGSIFIPGIAIYSYHFGADEAARLARGGVKIGENSTSSHLQLEEGNILLSPHKDIKVDTSECNVQIAPGASVFIMKSAGDTIVYDLAQSSPNEVVVEPLLETNERRVNLEPGHMIVLTHENVPDFEQLKANCHSIAYCKTVKMLLNDQSLFGYKANFSVASALVTVEPLKRLSISTYKNDKDAIEKLVKAAVVMGDASNLPQRQDTSTAVAQKNQTEK